MRHLNKGNSAKAIYRGKVSSGVIGHARTGLLVAQNPDDEKGRILCVTKYNLAGRLAALRFRLNPVDAVGRVVRVQLALPEAGRLPSRGAA